MLKILKKYPFSSIIVTIIWFLCFMKVPKTPLSNINLIDKWTHALMYLILGLIIFWEMRRHVRIVSFKKIFYGIFLFPAIMGGLIEILQTYCTNGQRSGEWYDFYADIIGSCLASLICILLVRLFSRT